MRAALTTLAVLLFALPLSGQSSSTLAMPILQGAALPMYPPIAKAAHITGRVIVRVTVKIGQVAKIDILSKPDVASGHRYLEHRRLRI
jgi:outer membrane biosynthesis protein TonB